MRRAGDLDSLFRPRSVAVLGVSRNPAKLGHRLLKNVLDYGFAGSVFPVNPSGEPILGLPTVASGTDLPSDIDLALVSLPGPEVLPAVRLLAARRVRVAVILSSGFGEVDAEGRVLQAELRATASESGMRLVGPNCMGVYSNPGRLNGTYFLDLPRTAGGISVVSQSGAYGGLIIRHLGSLGLGLSKFLSIGNQVDLEVADLLGYLAEDPETTLIAAFIESVRDGKRFVETARRATDRKPVVVLKAGRTEAGRRAAGSHTGALAGTFEVYQAAFRRAGIVACGETEEFFDAIQCLAKPRRSFPTGRGVAIVTVSGGPSVIAADAAEALGLSVPALASAVRQRLGKLLPSFAAMGNPVDLTPQVAPAKIAEGVRVVLSQDEIAGAVAINVGLDLPEFADGMIQASRSADKPIVACAVDVPGVAEKFHAAGIPVYPTPERAVRAYRALALANREAGTLKPPPPVPPRFPNALRRLLETGRGPLPYAFARRILRTYGIPFCREGHATSARETLKVAKQFGYPVVLKAERPGVMHKTEAHAVRVDIRTPRELRVAHREMTTRLGTGPFLIQQQVGPGVELLVGGKRDPTFGPVVVCGTGGILADALGDVSLRLAPLALEDAREMLKEGLKGRLLRGFRGMPPCDPEPLVKILLAVSHLLTDHPRIRDLDLNPVIVAGTRALAVDALLILES
ncbi:MAG: acetate--CoA ligase family protein [Candidatus Rokubacteria bacterium]|nr:acetate--CoA ligase family protein [Candidatus Rokubacteria bacterium]